MKTIKAIFTRKLSRFIFLVPPSLCFLPRQQLGDFLVEIPVFRFQPVYLSIHRARSEDWLNNRFWLSLWWFIPRVRQSRQLKRISPEGIRAREVHILWSNAMVIISLCLLTFAIHISIRHYFTAKKSEVCRWNIPPSFTFWTLWRLSKK